MGMALLLLSWLIEWGAGAWFCYYFWTFGCWRCGADASIAGPGYVPVQVRGIGWALVVDGGVLESKHLPALLAHELGHCNSLDLLVRTLYLVFPPLEWSVLTLIGMPNGCGKIALYPLWMKYWRDRVFACDEYAARLGQGYQLVRALDELKWARNGRAATGGGRWLRDTPYIESRIDRLMRCRGLQE